MKRIISMLLTGLLLTGCGVKSTQSPATLPLETTDKLQTQKETTATPEYTSRFHSVTEILLSDEGIQVSGNGETDSVFTSCDIIYYEDKETYDSGNPYGEGTESDRHTAEEAARHTVVNITTPGAYRVSGKLSAGQIRIDLGEDCYKNENAVVELILQNADITCSVAPAILFLNTYECDGDWSTETATAYVDTSSAGANLILEGKNTVTGSHVAKIFKDKDGEKKLWKQDGAVYSYRSMNIYGPGSLELTADNEGLGTEMHLTINGGNISIESQNDGINTNEDGVSVTTINGGDLTIFAGLGEEGDGIDSNGYLVINGGNVMAAANPKADAGLDSDLGSYIHGGTVIAMGSTMDWAESDSKQVTLNLQFSSQQKACRQIKIADPGSTEYLSFEPDDQYARPFSGLILSHPGLTQGATYHIYVDDVQMVYTENDVGKGLGGKRPDGARPEGMKPPADFDPSQMDGRDPRPEGFNDERPEGVHSPESFHPDRFGSQPGEIRTDFYMGDKVNAFSGVTAAEQ